MQAARRCRLPWPLGRTGACSGRQPRYRRGTQCQRSGRSCCESRVLRPRRVQALRESVLRDSTKCRQTRSMKEGDLTRRSFVKQSALAAVTTLPLASTPAESAAPSLKIVCVGAHPDDPESGCGGTLARYAALGHAVTIVYLTRGERGVAGKSLDEAARIRTAECEAACRIIGAKPLFFGQIDGATKSAGRTWTRCNDCSSTRAVTCCSRTGQWTRTWIIKLRACSRPAPGWRCERRPCTSLRSTPAAKQKASCQTPM